MKLLILPAILCFSLLNFELVAEASPGIQKPSPAKVVRVSRFHPTGESPAEPEIVKMRLVATVTRSDCNERSLVGKLLDTEADVAVADFAVAAPAVDCPIPRPVTETIYSEPFQITLKESGKYDIYFADAFELEVLP